MLTVNEYCRRTFGEKLYKLSLNGGMTCPNRDGTCGDRGCIFCSAGGSGDFTPDASLPVSRQIEEAKARVAGKFGGGRYIAYFQAYTNTYAPVEKLRKLFTEVIERPDIAVLSVATRPDCLEDGVADLLKELNGVKPVWVELGLQTVKPETVEYIRRGYATEVYDEAVEKLNACGIHTVTHVILGLPGETRGDMLETVRHAVRCGTRGIKLQLLHVLEGTDLAEDYRAGKFRTLTPEEYVSILKDCVALLPEDTVVHRLTGDGPKRILIAPLWSGDKKRFINLINRELGLNGKTAD
ncbi:MAG: TIGR01212 family radical SAM protein [Oscillospiraceae bacterium]|nr:TIGR01212 family radical SAM protein [Oscillospiraceae bacterium]